MNDEIYLSDVFAPVMAKWKPILLLALIGATIGFICALRTPRSYESTATIFVQQNSPTNSLLSSLPISLGSISSNSIGYYTTLLNSETLLRNVISRLALLKDPEFTRGRKIGVRAAVRTVRSCTAIKEDKNGSIDISAKWENPELAAKIANGILDSLGEMVFIGSRHKVNFVGRKLQETTKALQEAEDKLLDFQKRTGVPVVEEEAKRVINQLGNLEANLLVLDVELEAARSELVNSGDLDVLVQQEIRKKGIESSRDYVLKRKAELTKTLARLPEVASEYVRLQRSVTVLSKTFELLTEKYQLAKIDQQGENGDYQVIDRARPADMPLSRGLMQKTMIGGIEGFVVASVVVMAGAVSRQRRKGRK